MPKPSTYSVSRLKSYIDCSKYYEHKYINQDYLREISYSTVLGSLVHVALENYYLSNLLGEVLFWLKAKLGPELVTLGVLKEEEVDVIKPLLLEYAESISTLYVKASPSYKGVDAIRTRKGEVPQNPLMTSAWKLMSDELGLDGTKEFIDNYVSSSNPSIDFSITDAVSEAYYLVSKYVSDPLLSVPLHIELPISLWNPETDEIRNPVKIPSKYGAKDVYLSGYVDLVSETGNGEILVDHKTSKSSFSSIDVEHNVQLLTYVYAYRELFGRKPEYIGINNIRDGVLNYVATPSDDFIEEILDTLFKNHSLIELGIFHKHTPEPYSPCKALYGKPCPYLSKCWPTAIS